MNATKIIMPFLIMAAAIAVFADDETPQWVSGDSPDSLGSLSLTYENGAVKTIVATPVGNGTITLAGDAIDFASDATVTMAAAGTLVFSNDVAGNGLSCSRTGQQFTYSGAALPAYAEGNPGALMFEDLSLDAVTPVASRFSGELAGVARPYFIVREAGRLEVQMQSQCFVTSYNAGQTQSAKLVLVQNGADIYGSVVWTKTNGSEYGDYRGRKDFTDAGESVAGTVDNLTVALTAGMDDAEIAFAGALSGSVAASGGVRVSIDARRAAYGGVFANAVSAAAGSAVVLRNSSGISVTSAISGAGDIVFENDSVYSYKRDGFFYTAADMDTAYHTTSMVFKTNARLSNVTNVKAVVGCYNKGVLPVANNGNGYVLLSSTATTQRWQIQGLDKSTGANFMRCATLEFTQVGDDIFAKYAEARQGSGTQGSELVGSQQKVTASTSDSANGAAVYVYDVELEFSEPIELAATSLSGVNTMDSGEYRANGGVTLSLDSKFALPCMGSVVAGNGSSVLFNFAMSEQATSYGSNTCALCVQPGGTLRQTTRFSIGYMFSIWNDGGAVVVDHVVESGFDGYLNHIWMRDGATVNMSNVYCGKIHAGNWYVSGSTPCSASASPLYLYGDNSATAENPKPRTFTVDVEDVTGDDGVDFTFTGNILTPQNVAFTNVTVLKRGSGTWLLNGTYSCVGPTLVSGGFFKLGRTGTMNASQNISLLFGGGLALAEGVSNAIGKVSLTTAGVLDVPTTSTLVVDSIENLANATLTITNELSEAGGQIRVLNVPSRSDLKRIAYGELGVSIDANGWLIPKRKRGLVISVK